MVPGMPGLWWHPGPGSHLPTAWPTCTFSCILRMTLQHVQHTAVVGHGLSNTMQAEHIGLRLLCRLYLAFHEKTRRISLAAAQQPQEQGSAGQERKTLEGLITQRLVQPLGE